MPIAAFLLSALVLPAGSAPAREPAPAPPLASIAEIRSLAADGRPVRLTGRFVRWLGPDEILFRDRTGSLPVDVARIAPEERRRLPLERDLVLLGEVDLDRRGRLEVDLHRFEPALPAPAPAPAVAPPPAPEARFLPTSVARILERPARDQRVEFRARVEAWIDGNDYLLADGPARLRVDGGPPWHHRLELSPGELVLVRGEVGFDRAGRVEVDVWEVVRPSGQVLRIRGEGPPPWAGGPRRGERRGGPPAR